MPLEKLNPRFESQIPVMLESLAQSILACKPHLDESATTADQYLDHLQFEIDKLTLAIDKLEWSDKVDRENFEALKQQRDQLTLLRDSFPIEGAKSSIAFMEKLREAMILLRDREDPAESTEID